MEEMKGIKRSVMTAASVYRQAAVIVQKIDISCLKMQKNASKILTRHNAIDRIISLLNNRPQVEIQRPKDIKIRFARSNAVKTNGLDR